MTRPGRLDLLIPVPLPTRLERVAILRQLTRAAPGVEVEALAAATEGWSGAQLRQLHQEAALSALREADAGGGRDVVLTMRHFTERLRAPAT